MQIIFVWDVIATKTVLFRFWDGIIIIRLLSSLPPIKKRYVVCRWMDIMRAKIKYGFAAGRAHSNSRTNVYASVELEINHQ